MPTTGAHLREGRGPVAPLLAPDAFEDAVGMSRFLAATPGTGGRLRTFPEDFVVGEIPLAFPAPTGEGKYTVAAVRARNWETNRLMREIADRLKVSRQAVFFAGTKDKRAVTTQYVSVPAPEDRVRALAIKDVEILETFRVDRAPKIGELVGNRFEIAVRDLPIASDDARTLAEATLADLHGKGGFPNYFGLQRFGQVRPITHVVGRLLVLGDLEGAVMAYAANPMEADPPEVREARARLQESRDFASAARWYPEFLSFERTMIRHLAAKPGDWAGALLALPGNLLTMFVYAYQSLLFNRALSERLARGVGLAEPQEGDLLLPADAHGVPSTERPVAVTSANLAKARLQVARGRAFVSGLVTGSDPPWSGGLQGEIERAVVEAEGIPVSAFRVAALPEAGSSGTRRALHARPAGAAVQAGSDAHGEKVTLAFGLSKGCYATCLVREITKSPYYAF
ncbi:MAG TPA: tRNA pseudouridine(13) synthase TruD [Candidatus Thermoplasmatota archaeon]|nr:tRNA pseudouridine(13) synthase TruD [Candidatus Thermoplasmatota archaeon]